MAELQLQRRGGRTRTVTDWISLTTDRGGQKDLAGIVVPYESGWYLHPLPAARPVVLNGKPVTASTRVRVGDVIQTSGRAWTVTASRPATNFLAKLVGPCCEVAATCGTATATAAVTEISPVLIGSDPACDVRVTGDGVKPFHALLAYHDAVWHLHDLSGSGIDRLSASDTRRSVAVVSGEELSLGRVGLCVRCQPLNRLSQAVSPEVVATTGGTPSTAEGPALPTVAAPVRRSQTTVDPLAAAAQELGRWISQDMPAAHADAVQAGRLAPGRGWVPPADPYDAIRFYRTELAHHPGDRQLMFAVADLFAALGGPLAPLERQVLKEMLRYHESDGAVLLRVAERVLADGCDPTKPLPRRQEDLTRANKYATRARDALPGDAAVAELLRRVGAELSALGPPRQPVG